MPGAGVRVRRAASAAALAALVALGLLPTEAGRTSAAWTDAGAFTAVVTSGTWASGPGAGAVVPGNAGTTVTDLAWTVPYVLHVCVAVTVSTSSYAPVEWRAQVDYAAAPFRGDTAMGHYVLEGDSGWVERLDDTPSAGLVQFGGRSSSDPARDYRHLSADPDDGIPSSRTFTLCDRNLPDPRDDPAQTYQVTQTSGAPTNPYNACQEFRVAVTSATYPFYVGWHADVDLGAAFAVRRAAGLSATSVAVRSGGVAATRLAGDVYRVTSTQTYTAGVRSASPSGGDAAVTQSFTLCAQ